MQERQKVKEQAHGVVIELLTNIHNSQLDSIIKQQQRQYDIANVELWTLVQKTTDSHRHILSLIHKANQPSLHTQLNQLTQLCPQSAQQFREGIVAQANIRHTLQILRILENIQYQVTSLRQQLINEEDLADIVNKGLQLTEIKEKLLEKSPNFEQLLRPIIDFEQELELHLWRIIENSVEVSVSNPQALIKVVKALMNPKTQDQIKVRAVQGFRSRLESFLCSDKLEVLSSHTNEALNDVAVIKNKTAPCFPADMDMQQSLISEFRDVVESKMIPFLSDIAKIQESPGSLVLIAGWLDNYITILSRYCSDLDNDMNLQTLVAKSKELMPEFLSHIEKLTSEWLSRIQSQEISPQAAAQLAQDNKPIVSTYPQDTFSAIYQTLEFVENRLKGEVLIEVFKVLAGRLKSQKRKQLQMCQGLMENDYDVEQILPALCLRLNNAYRCTFHINELRDKCSTLVQQSVMNLTRIDKIFDQVKTEFYSLAGEIGQYIALSVLKYIANDTIGLVLTQQWEKGRPFARAFATAQEYEQDLKRWIEPAFYANRFMRTFVEYLVKAYLERLLITKNYNPELLTKLNVMPLRKTKVQNLQDLILRDIEEFSICMRNIQDDYPSGFVIRTLGSIVRGSQFDSRKFMQSGKESGLDENLLNLVISTISPKK